MISVVVPTRDRPLALARCLGALDQQRNAELQIIVVDDGSKDPPGVAKAVGGRARVTLLRSERAGPAAARNAGVRAASCEVVLFLDDDCVPHPDWAATLERAVISSDADVIGGRTVYDRRRALVAASETVVQHAESHLGFVATRNAGCLRTVALEHPFDERFRDAAAEDRAWCASLLRAGGSLGREVDAVVHHDVLLDVRGFLRQHRRYGRGARLLARSGPSARLGGPRFVVGLVATSFRHGFRVGLLVLVSQVATLVGYARGA